MLDAIATVIIIGMMFIPLINLLVGAIVGAGLGGILGGIVGIALALLITAIEKMISDWRSRLRQPRPTDDAIATADWSPSASSMGGAT